MEIFEIFLSGKGFIPWAYHNPLYTGSSGYYITKMRRQGKVLIKVRGTILSHKPPRQVPRTMPGDSYSCFIR